MSTYVLCQLKLIPFAIIIIKRSRYKKELQDEQQNI